jgi:hypothetical protein
MDLSSIGRPGTLAGFFQLPDRSVGPAINHQPIVSSGGIPGKQCSLKSAVDFMPGVCYLSVRVEIGGFASRIY